MEALDAVAPLVAVLAPAALVLRDAAAYDRAPADVPGAPPADESPAGQLAGPEAGSAVAAETLGTHEAPATREAPVPIVTSDLVAERDPLAEPVGVGGGGGGVRTAVGADGGGYERVELTVGMETTVVAADPVLAEDSVLSGLRYVEPDEQSALRRVAAFLLLLVITLGTAALVAALIYNAVSELR